MRAGLFAGAVALCAVSVSPAAAQGSSDAAQVEQSFLPGALNLGCEVFGGLLGKIFGAKVKQTVDSLGGAVGICKKPGAEPAVTTTPAVQSSAMPVATAATIVPGLQIHLYAVHSPDGDPSLELAGPNTVYKQNEGFGAIVSHNSTGYLEVWSVDNTTTTFIEGVVLGASAGSVTLPKTVEGFYRLTTAGGSDKIRFRFFPCRYSTQQAFTPQANQKVALLLDTQAAAVAKLDTTLNTCPFSPSDIDTTKPNAALFASIANVVPSYSATGGAFTAVVPKGAMQTEIVLKRE